MSDRRGGKRLFEIFASDGKPPTPQKAQTSLTQSDGSRVITADDRSRSNYGLSIQQLAKSKNFTDSIHGQITMEPLCLRIIDTPEYQRLHYLKQLGTCDFVFRGATHTRFEHSLGVGHLAERLLRTIKTNQPELGITDIDILCVKIAGICHDLGHGPYSHVFDGVFIKRMYPNGVTSQGKKWRHEDGSVQMFQLILQKNNVRLSDFGLTANDKLFIEEIIAGVPEQERKGRDKDKYFLYDVVNNSRSGLDVDKLDYFQRDMSMSCVSGGKALAHEFDRFIELARVMPAEPIGSNRYASPTKTGDSHDIDSFPLMICYPEKMVREAVSVFSTRFHMHQQVYTHKSVKEVEFMITDILELANPYIEIPGRVTEAFPTGKYKLSEVIFDMEALANVKDSILDVITLNTHPELQPAQHIIRRLWKRDLYICIGKTSMVTGDANASKSESDICDEIISCAHSSAEKVEWSGVYEDESARLGWSPVKKRKTELLAEDIIVEKMHIHYGMGGQNPVDRLRFFPKPTSDFVPQVARQVDEAVYETLLPRSFEDRSIRVFCRHKEKESMARQAFESWCKQCNVHSPFPTCSQQTADAFDDEW